MASEHGTPLDLNPVFEHLLTTKVNARINHLVDDLGLDSAPLAMRKAFLETMIDTAVAAVAEHSAVLIEQGVDVRLYVEADYPADEDYDDDDRDERPSRT